MEKPKPQKISKTVKRNKPKKPVNQIEINFGDGLEFEDELEPVVNEAPEPPKKSADIEPEVIVLSVVMPEGTMISGAALLPTLLTLGMKFGDMNIFIVMKIMPVMVKLPLV